MVSFQCNGCGDVVKKPKLDGHHAACHSSFDCIDCSKTFHTPAEFKVHTSCISEAEKYQKSLYKGPKGKQNQRLGGVERNGKGKSHSTITGDEQGRSKSEGQSNTRTIAPTEPPILTSDPTEATRAKPKKDKKSKEMAKSNVIADEEAQEPIVDLGSATVSPSPEKPSDSTTPESKDKDKKKRKKKDLKDGGEKDKKLIVDTDERDEVGEKVKKRKKARKDASSMTVFAGEGNAPAVEDSAMDVDYPNVHEKKETQAAIADPGSIPSPEKLSESTSRQSKEKDKKKKRREKDRENDGDKPKENAAEKKKKAKKDAPSVVVNVVEDPAMDTDQANTQRAEVLEGKKKKKARNLTTSTTGSGETPADDQGSEGKNTLEGGKSKKRKRTEVESTTGKKRQTLG